VLAHGGFGLAGTFDDIADRPVSHPAFGHDPAAGRPRTRPSSPPCRAAGCVTRAGTARGGRLTRE
jgi:hypothetical protein